MESGWPIRPWLRSFTAIHMHKGPSRKRVYSQECIDQKDAGRTMAALERVDRGRCFLGCPRDGRKGRGEGRSWRDAALLVPIRKYVLMPHPGSIGTNGCATRHPRSERSSHHATRISRELGQATRTKITDGINTWTDYDVREVRWLTAGAMRSCARSICNR